MGEVAGQRVPGRRTQDSRCGRAAGHPGRGRAGSPSRRPGFGWTAVDACGAGELIANLYWARLTEQAVGTYPRRWGLSFQRPDERAVERVAEGRPLTWGVNGYTPVVRRTGNQFSANAMSAIGHQGPSRMRSVHCRHAMVCIETSDADVRYRFPRPARGPLRPSPPRGRDPPALPATPPHIIRGYFGDLHVGYIPRRERFDFLINRQRSINLRTL